jgi:hypothetical protein
MLGPGGNPRGDTSPGDARACLLEAYSGRSSRDFRLSGETTGGGIGMLNIVSAALRHWLTVRPVTVG